MMKRNKNDFEDDGRTIADMSEISRPPLLIPRIPGLEKKKEGQTANRPDLNRSEERGVIAGALAAALLIALAFIAGGGLLIWLLTLVW